MIFSSIGFIFAFLPITVFVYYILEKNYSAFSIPFLVVASLFFYAYWKPIYLPLIVISAFVNYCIGRLVSVEKDNSIKRTVLSLGILLNIATLALFKYADFIFENVNIVTGLDIEPLNLLLPLAISFFTFQQIAFLVDSYKGEVDDYSISDYFLFVTFFPQLIAGPIVHHKQMMPQFSSSSKQGINLGNIEKGILIFSIGLFKKLIIADFFGGYADVGYESVDHIGFWGAWATSLSYTIQLYYDFSGYCDMAIGAALFFNINLPINFNSPYKALNIQDFWRRWHMTLSTWLRDYVYIPMGGNRKSSRITSRNLLLTFFIGGVWHGAGWGFVLWGILHGLALVFHRMWTSTGLKMSKYLGWFVTFMFVHVAWVFFRAPEISVAFELIEKLFTPDLADVQNVIQNLFVSYHMTPILLKLDGPVVVLYCIFVLAYTFIGKNSIQILESEYIASWNVSLVAAAAFVIGVMALIGSKSQTFLYFNF
ncbi:MBOAT family O-acyltransferase [Reinekea blandensis]|uniref:Probable alginate O-acetylase n=1 Tax=Reinekea blandensis MED297 TaxID=314283 RepID=A4BIY6_9GAMM|nr:MBOAT family protein [Reinekea blandensis]EAR07919.1 putative alginate O-acetylation protein [Reinekea sp. MED297] [Reinekea blandensis MED297]